MHECICTTGPFLIVLRSSPVLEDGFFGPLHGHRRYCVKRFAKRSISVALLTSLDLYQSASVWEFFFIILLHIPWRKECEKLLKQIECILPMKWVFCLTFQAELIGQSLVCAVCYPHADPYLNCGFTEHAWKGPWQHPPPDLHQWEHVDPGKQRCLTLGWICQELSCSSKSWAGFLCSSRSHIMTNSAFSYPLRLIMGCQY